MLRELQHPHIVRFYGLEREGAVIFILMAYIAGQSLRDTLRARDAPLSGSEVAHYLRPVVAALHYAHQKNIYHCDVKSSNVLVDGTVRVLLWAYKRRLRGVVEVAPAWVTEGILSASEHIGADRAVLWFGENR